MKRRTCRDFAEARSAYVDGYLGEAERQALLAHLSDCATCREEVAALQRLRSLLTDTGRQTDSAVPGELAHRLAAIAEQDDARPTVRIRTLSLAGVALLLVLVTGVGYVAAPAERGAVADPSDAVRTDFSAALTQLPLTSTAVAAALLADPQRLRTADADVESEPPMNGPRLDQRQIVGLLDKAEWASARTPYSGVQRVVAPRDDQTTAANVAIDFTPGTGSRVVVRALNGDQVAAGRMPTPAASRIAATDLISALTSGYRLTGTAGGTAVGRPVALIQARPKDSRAAQPAANWWIDTQTGLVIRQDVYDHAGRLVLSARYASLTIGGNRAAAAAEPGTPSPNTSTALLTRPLTTATFTTASAATLSNQGWFCHSELAGLPLVRLRADAPAEPGVLHMVYTDGLSTVSVFERRGQLSDPASTSTWDPNLGAYRRDAMVNTATWQSGNNVFTVATDGPTALRDTVVQVLPHQKATGRTTMGRIRAGWSRILHAMG